MLIFGLPPSDPAPEFEPGLNLGLTPPPYLAPSLGYPAGLQRKHTNSFIKAWGGRVLV